MHARIVFSHFFWRASHRNSVRCAITASGRIDLKDYIVPHADENVSERLHVYPIEFGSTIGFLVEFLINISLERKQREHLVPCITQLQWPNAQSGRNQNRG